MNEELKNKLLELVEKLLNQDEKYTDKVISTEIIEILEKDNDI